MPIVFAYPGGVKQYQAECGTLCPYQPDKCPECTTSGRLVKHGVYWRKPRDGEQACWIAIHRWRCKACRHNQQWTKNNCMIPEGKIIRNRAEGL